MKYFVIVNKTHSTQQDMCRWYKIEALEIFYGESTTYEHEVDTLHWCN